MSPVNLAYLDAWDATSGAVNVIIETVQDSRNKLKYEPATGSFALSTILPSGAVFPYDFGFIPSTLGDDGDPVDVLVLMDVPAFPGCRVPCRLVAVLEAEQVEEGQSGRNDRLVAVAEQSHDHKNVRSVKDIDQHLLEEIEHFFVSYNEMAGKEFKPLGWHGPNRAKKLAQKGAKRFRQNGQRLDDDGQPRQNGRPKTRKAK